MSPKVLRVTQVSTVDARNNVVAAFQVQFQVGTHGPFTITVSQEELQNGTAQKKMQDFANALASLPLQQSV